MVFAARDSSIRTLSLDGLRSSAAIHKRITLRGSRPALCFWVFDGPHTVPNLTDKHWKILERKGLVREKTRDIKNLPPDLRQAFRKIQACLQDGDYANVRPLFDQILAFYTSKNLELPAEILNVYTKLLLVENPLPSTQRP